MELEKATVKVNSIIDVTAVQCTTEISHLAYAPALTQLKSPDWRKHALLEKRTTETEITNSVGLPTQKTLILRSDINMTYKNPSRKISKTNKSSTSTRKGIGKQY